ncbi:ASN_HP2_G0034930.mRNA.1.CDS.1 [Saccharomyces cerevisiae]|nr:BGN_3a_G0036280.mRNA.1.CDS.1 [Saccharomyces cerevisiae]CAI5296926.1 ASN_HP2_G0034930.mRNA.1.CDS.1 [Saccharomyces cerevisiae]CAI6621206.1 ASN_HP2_G0034930.mRNA.1.CDS.1 [Saccharomyces cerevisiae]CAI6658190.1 ASN_HP1_G0035830.mRNA.1.CDS.1 [Saccharomyces cerevisiae]CAI7231873.1 BGN_3a_G0036280.mRNA.1.CDS.1 [Saccharomyces cerevisiae]
MCYSRQAIPPPVPNRPGGTTNRGPPPLPPRANVQPPVCSSENSSKPRENRVAGESLRTPSSSNPLADSQVNSDNIFQSPVLSNLKAPPSVFNKVQHPVPKPNIDDQSVDPLETNKFYTNMLLDDNTQPIWTHPYSIWFSRDPELFGLAANHTLASQRVFDTTTNPPRFYFNPTNIKSFVFKAREFVSSNDIKLEFRDMKHMSMCLLMSLSSSQFIEFPLVQGMGFVTAIYHDLGFELRSAVGFRSLERISVNERYGKYNIQLENNRNWILYLTSPDYSFPQDFQISLLDSNTIISSHKINGLICQLSADSVPSIDMAAGCYPVYCDLSGQTVDEHFTNYRFNYTVAGYSQSGTTLMYALPHHKAAFTPEMQEREIASSLDSTVKGLMTGYLTNSFDMQVQVPQELGFEPVALSLNKKADYSQEKLSKIREAAVQEVQLSDPQQESNIDSMYFSGKILAKYAWILYVTHYILHDENLTKELLSKLTIAMERFISNQQVLPLNYDVSWKGIISSGSSSQDFGNSYYNDHHFHYSYHVITAAIISLVDSDLSGVTNNSWLENNRDWVECLIRDYSGVDNDDPYFPQFRSFDWFNGHSWAKGLFPSGDGKDEESTSEDVNSCYAIKLWGLVTGNSKLTDIANLQLGIMRNVFQSYFLYESNNTVQPKELIGNKVSGILFENKIDHATYFGMEPQYIHMIHAIPITSASSWVRTPNFVKEEWEEKMQPIIDQVNDGWKGIIMLNMALLDPKFSYDFFSQPDFNRNFLDNGQSLTWSLAYSGAFS